MKKFYYSKDEMIKDAKLEAENILGEYNTTVKKVKEHNKKCIFIIILCLILFKIIIGTIEINSPFSYSKNRLYKVTINKTHITAQVIDHHRTVIIPFFLYLNAYHKETYSGVDSDSIYYLVPEETKYVLNIESYSCFSKSKKQQIECQAENNFQEVKNNDTVYTNLYIRRNGRPEKEIYDGELIKNITPYIQEKGLYYVRIDAEYRNVSSKLEFFLEQK